MTEGKGPNPILSFIFIYYEIIFKIMYLKKIIARPEKVRAQNQPGENSGWKKEEGEGD